MTKELVTSRYHRSIVGSLLMKLTIVNLKRAHTLELYVYVCVCVCVHIQGVTGGRDKTSGECSLC